MANNYFVVQNGLQVGPLIIDAATGDIATSGNVSISGQIGVSSINTLDSSLSINDTGTDSTITLTLDSVLKATFDSTALNLASGSVYEIAGSSVLSATTLGSGVVNSSLTNVGTLTGLAVSGETSLTGNLSVTGGSITGALIGNASTATTLQTARTISLAGDVTGSVSFDGSQNVSITAAVVNDSHSHTVSTITNFSTEVADVVGAMVGQNTEAGIAVTYDVNTNKLNFDVDDFTITLAGDLSGSATITDLANATLTATINADSVALGTDTTGNYVASATTVGNGISGSVAAESGVFTVTSNATADNTISTIVFRDESGDFSAGTITAALAGNSSTASKWATARTITLGGDATGSVSIDGSSNVTLTVAVVDDSHNHVIGNIDNFTEEVEDIVGAMVSGNTESGISVTYNDAAGKLNFDVNDPTITLSGDVAGSATMTNLGSVTITTTIQPNSIALGTDTTGSYVSTIAGTTNRVIVTGSGAENAAVTLSLPQDIHTGANPTFAGATLDAVRVGISAAGEIDTTTGGLLLDSASGTTTIDDDLVVSGNLTVNGTTLTVNSEVKVIEDPVITLGGVSPPTSDDGKDRGVDFRWHDGADAKLGFFGFDDTTGKFTFIPDATNSAEVFSGTKGVVDANMEWADVLNKPDPVITLSGDASGSVTLTDLTSGTLAVTLTKDPVVTLTGAVTGSGTMTNLGSVTITTTATSDPTLTLAGDVTGSATFTNLGNATLTAVVANDSHTHDGRYYTEAEADSRFVNAAGDTITGDLTVNGTLNVRTAIDLADNDILRFGSGDDCELFTNGTHMYMDLNGGIGNFYIRDGTTTRFTFDDAGVFTATGNIVTGGVFQGTATSAQYADLAENYQGDAAYEPGTVLMFGGSEEVTMAEADTRAVAGVVSTAPAYLMNSGLETENVATIALQGRVPCRVIGAVRKGDMMVSAGDGKAKASADPKLGQVIGKALEDAPEGFDGVIEVVIGRM